MDRLRFATNVYRLGVKELWSLWRDPIMLVFVVYVFTVSVYTSATASPETLNRASIAIVDEDASSLSARIVSAFFPPQFTRPKLVSLAEVDPGMDSGEYTFVLDIPPDFQRDVLGRRGATLQLNVDATRVGQAFTGSGYIQAIALGEIEGFLRRHSGTPPPPVSLALRARFNPTLAGAWFGSVMAIINNVSMVAILLTGAALIREREHGTIEHLLVMPVTPAEIMIAKLWSMGLVVIVAVALSLKLVVQQALQVGIEGSVTLFLACAALSLFAMSSIGIFMATMTRSMPQFALLLILVLMPLQMLSGGMSPAESMPDFIRHIMRFAPTTHFVAAAQAILYRGAGFDIVWPQFAWIGGIGIAFFAIALARFRRTIALMV
ncbi:MAG: ABC transporter permease [Burkholderiaceae bacterium]|nr:ABC transporter permease [Burkholderiaceae bacterium]